MSENMQNYIYDFITANREMALNAAENEIAGSCRVQYASPDGRNLYFWSRTATRHCQIFTNYPRVTAVILDPVGAFGTKKWVQLVGKVEKVCAEAELKEVAAWYGAAFPSSKNMIASLLPGMTGPGAPSAFYRVAVESLRVLNFEAAFSRPDFVAA